jgi:hypothetical protein
MLLPVMATSFSGRLYVRDGKVPTAQPIRHISGPPRSEWHWQAERPRRAAAPSDSPEQQPDPAESVGDTVVANTVTWHRSPYSRNK